MSEIINNTIDIKDRLNVEQIELLLNKHYGNGKHSLVVGKEDDVILKDKVIYYYDRSIEKDLLDMVDLLNDGYSKIGTNKFIEFDLNLNKKYKDCQHVPQCACLQIDSIYGWKIEIKRIHKVRIHRTYNKKIIANLVLSNAISVLRSIDKDKMYGYWGRPKYYRFHARRQETEGVSYSFNKNMIYNKAFRNFSFDFFNLVADIEKKYILKDVARSIKNCGFMLVPISYQLLSQLHKPSDIFNFYNNENDLSNINYNKVDINVGYIINTVSRFVDKKDEGALRGIATSELTNMIDLHCVYTGMTTIESIKNFFKKYYTYYYNCNNDESKNGILKDYINMSFELNEPLRIDCSFKKIMELHDRLAIDQRLKEYSNVERIQLVPENSMFNILETELLNSDKGIFKRIHNTSELFEEGVSQHNCVFTRKKLIYNDYVSIFHWDYEEKNYTIQFWINFDGEYEIEEIRAKYNEECEKNIIDMLEAEIIKINNNYKNELKNYRDYYNEYGDLPFM